MQTSSSSSTKREVMTKNGHQSDGELMSYRSFLNAVDYKGEHCSSCGHSWNEKGELHYRHCRFFVPSHLHNAKNH